MSDSIPPFPLRLHGMYGDNITFYLQAQHNM